MVNLTANCETGGQVTAGSQTVNHRENGTPKGVPLHLTIGKAALGARLLVHLKLTSCETRPPGHTGVQGNRARLWRMCQYREGAHQSLAPFFAVKATGWPWALRGASWNWIRNGSRNFSPR